MKNIRSNDSQAPIRLTHIVTGLNVGGAEIMLLQLLSHMDKRRFDMDVISLTDVGLIGQQIQELNIPVKSLNLGRGLPNPLAVLRLAWWLRKQSPQVVQTWMYHADLVGGIAARLAGVPSVVWGIHHGNLDPDHNRQRTLQIVKANAFLSNYLPASIICCAHTSRRVHAQAGYADSKMLVISNGFDLEKFRPDAANRESIRNELEIPKDAPLIGMIARFHPQKDHMNFVQAASILHKQFPDVHFLLCGQGIEWENSDLADPVRSLQMTHRFHLLGPRDDVPRIAAALDIGTISSLGEGFPNVVGEMMACAVPCVVTNVGDAAVMVGDTGRVVPPRAPQALSAGWAELLTITPEERQALGQAAHHRIQTLFSMPAITDAYQALYIRLAESEFAR
ncbi:MAG: glycosyltransferase [Caldilineaceae bacterium]